MALKEIQIRDTVEGTVFTAYLSEGETIEQRLSIFTNKCEVVYVAMNEAKALDYASDHGVRVSTDSQRARVISFWVDDRISAHKVSRFKGTRAWTIDGGMVDYSRGEAIRDCVNRILAARLVRELV